jgi:hypothetical protein
MISKNKPLWLLTVLQMHLVDEEWKLPRRENDRIDLTHFSYCQTGRPHSVQHVQGTLPKIPEPKISPSVSPSDANLMCVLTYCSRVVYASTYVSEE